MVINKSTKTYILILFAALVFIGLYLLNLAYPLYDDDWGYTFVYNEIPIRKVAGIVDILKSQYDHYFLWGGRTIVHIIAQTLLMLDPVTRAILKSLAFTAFVLMIYKICNREKDSKPFLFLLICAGVWFCIPMFPQNILQVTSSANYLWGTLLIISFLYFYIKYLFTAKLQDSIFKCILFFIAGIIVGWTNENTVFAMIFIIFGIIVFLKIQKQKIPVWFITGLTGSCIGAMLMLLAPGNAIRNEETIIYLNQVNSSFSELLIYRIRNIYWLYRYQTPVIFLNLLYIALLVVHHFKGDKTNKVKCIVTSLLCYLGAHLATVVMLGSPIFPYRVAFGIVTLFIIASGILFSNIKLDSNLVKYGSLAGACIIIVLLGNSYIKMYSNVLKFSDDFKKREAFVDEQKKMGNLDITLTEPIVAPWEFDFEDLSSDADLWRNKNFANYYGISRVKLNTKKQDE